MIKILLADDHQAIRKGLKALLGTESDFTIVGEAGDGLETVKLVEDLQPDVLILDIMMPGLNGLEVCHRLNANCPKTGIVILSMHNNEAYISEALRCGARAYLLKESPTEELITAIREVANGKYYLTSTLPEQVISDFLWQTKFPCVSLRNHS